MKLVMPVDGQELHPVGCAGKLSTREMPESVKNVSTDLIQLDVSEVIISD